MSDFLSRICYTVLTGLDSHDRNRLLLLVMHTGLRSTISIAYWAQITTSIAYWAQITTGSAYQAQIYLIFVTDATDGVRVNFFWPV